MKEKMERVFADVMAAMEASGAGEESADAAIARIAKGLCELRADAGIEDLLQAEAWCVEMDQHWSEWRRPATV